MPRTSILSEFRSTCSWLSDLGLAFRFLSGIELLSFPGFHLSRFNPGPLLNRGWQRLDPGFHDVPQKVCLSLLFRSGRQFQAFPIELSEVEAEVA